MKNSLAVIVPFFNEEGTIERVFTKVKTKEHTEQILESYQ